MVPVQTIFALLALLVMMSSCSQVAPPHSRTDTQSQTDTNLNNINQDPLATADVDPTPTPGDSINPSIDTTTNLEKVDVSIAGLAKLSLVGIDAERLYRLLAVNPAPIFVDQQTVGIIKQGNQFSCQHKRIGFSCEFVITLADGSVLETIPRDQVAFFQSEIAQVASSTYFLTIKAPSAGPKVRLIVMGDEAKTIYQGLGVSEVTLAASTVYAAGSRKSRTSSRLF